MASTTPDLASNASARLDFNAARDNRVVIPIVSALVASCVERRSDRYGSATLGSATHPQQHRRAHNSPAERDHTADQQGRTEIRCDVAQERERHVEDRGHAE